MQANLLSCDAGPEALGRAYNVACGERLSLNELVQQIGELAGEEIEPEYAAPRPGDIRHSVAAIELASRYLSYRPRVDFAEGLRHTWKELVGA